MRNYPELYIVTVNLEMDSVYYFSAVQGFFRTRKHAKQFQKASPFKGEIKTINPTDYALVIRKDIGEPEIILAKGSRFYEEIETAKKHFSVLYPSNIYSIVKFDETELYKQIIVDIDNENEKEQGAFYA